jgi:transcriptional regulator with XRE-family HTH domain
MSHPNNLQQFLDEHGLTQTEMAEGSGIAVSMVNGIVRGHTRPRTDTVQRLLAYCRTVDPEVTFEALFGDTEAVA